MCIKAYMITEGNLSKKLVEQTTFEQIVFGLSLKVF